VNPDGRVSPCCVVYRRDRDFADLNEPGRDLMSHWNNARYRTARALFSNERVADAEPTVCHGCDIFVKRH
jgi:hypothetical protein